MKFKKKYLLLLFIIAVAASIFFLARKHETVRANTTAQTRDIASGKALFKQHCGNCHLAPAPERLTKEIWETRVLPMMALKMGLEEAEYERIISEEEREVEKKNNVNSLHPMISKTDFDKISEFILANAPDSIHYASDRLNRNKPIEQFERQDISLDENLPSLITSVQFDSVTKSLWIGNYYNQVQNWKWGKGLLGALEVESPVVHFNFFQDNIFFTQIGDLLPSELSKGLFSYARGNKDAPVLTSLHRPVYAEIEDLDGDNIAEIIVCNFGKNIGSLSLYKKATTDGAHIEKVLLPMPGATKTSIIDMDGDGKKDIIALFAQGDESVYVFYNKGNLKFEPKRVLRFPPDYGTTDMALLDYNKDGLLDIVTAHGDNADYSIILKPYHGIRLHINEGKDVFSEEFFYSIYGVTKVVAEDFDKDGDIDFATSAFYPDYGALLEETFVYLENKNSKKFVFQSYISKSALPVKSLSLEKGDIDGDGDTDIILGTFALSPVPTPDSLEKKWKEYPYALILFKNTLH